jgi:hypothetical protein
MNRFTWDMRYPNAREFPGLILWAASTRGPAAPPGRYQVRVTASGITKTQDFEIRRNTAVPGVTDADLHAQFALASQISNRVTEAHSAVLRIRSVKTQLADRSRQAADPATRTAAQTLVDRLTEVEEEIYQHRLRSGQDPLNFPIRLNNKLAALQGTVESGDARPTEQSYAVFKDLSARLDKELSRVEALMKDELMKVNKSLEAVGLAPVKDSD